MGSSVDACRISPHRGSSCTPTHDKYTKPNCGLISIQREATKCCEWCMLDHQSKPGNHDAQTTSLHKLMIDVITGLW